MDIYNSYAIRENHVMKNHLSVRQILQRALTGGCIASLAASFIPVASAQDDAGANVLEEIVVTGSRLRRTRDLVAVSPVQTIDLDVIRTSGNVTLESTLNKYPQLKPDVTSTTNQSSSTGLLSANLRGMGAVRTLVLVNGKRFVPGDVTGLTDLANIPDMLIDRVEIVTGGASAVYGSDAIAGAVNFILKDDFEGAEIRYQMGETSRNDGGHTKIDLMIGANSADGRGNVTLLGSYTKRIPTYFADRDWAAIPLLADGNGVLQPFNVTTIPGALIQVVASDFDKIQGVDLSNSDGSCPGPIQGIKFGDGSVPSPFCRPTDGYNFADPNYLLRPLERMQITALGNYEINDNIEAYSQLTYTNNDNSYQMAADATYPTTPGQERGTMLIPGLTTNPLYSLGLRQFFSDNAAYFDSDGDGIYTVKNIGWQIEELGPRKVDAITDAYSVMGGLRGDIVVGGNETSWTWDTFYQFARSDVTINRQNRLSQVNLALGLDVVVVDGVPECRVKLLNCIPVSMFGTDALTDDMVAYLKVIGGRQDQFTRQMAGATATGTILDLPAGPLDSAFGMEFRREEFSTIPNSISASGQLGGRGNPPTTNNGDFALFEVFGEIRVPLLADHPVAEILAIEAAARYSDYSTIGDVVTWKTSLDWKLSEYARIRGGFSKAIRAPNLYELYSVRTSKYEGATSDPCVESLNPTAAQKEMCVKQGVPSADVDNLPERGVGIGVLSGGNPNLDEEEAETLTVGLVLTPVNIPGFSISLDYFDIQVDNSITQISAANLLNQCFSTLVFESPACQAIHRTSSGFIDYVEASMINISTRNANGVDLSILYSYELPAQYDASLDLTFVATKQFEESVTLAAGETPVECAGYYGGVCSSDRARIMPDFSAFLRADLGFLGGKAKASAQFNILGDLDLHPQGFYINYNHLEPRVIIDVNGSYQIRDNISIFGGVNNLGDKMPPLIGLRAGGDMGTNVQTFDPLGRRFYFGTTIGF